MTEIPLKLQFLSFHWYPFNKDYGETYLKFKNCFPSNVIFEVNIGYGNKYLIPNEMKDEFFEKVEKLSKEEHSIQMINKYFNQLFYPHTFYMNLCYSYF